MSHHRHHHHRATTTANHNHHHVVNYGDHYENSNVVYAFRCLPMRDIQTAKQLHELLRNKLNTEPGFATVGNMLRCQLLDTSIQVCTTDVNYCSRTLLQHSLHPDISAIMGIRADPCNPFRDTWLQFCIGYNQPGVAGSPPTSKRIDLHKVLDAVPEITFSSGRVFNLKELVRYSDTFTPPPSSPTRLGKTTMKKGIYINASHSCTHRFGWNCALGSDWLLQDVADMIEFFMKCDMHRLQDSADRSEQQQRMMMEDVVSSYVNSLSLE